MPTHPYLHFQGQCTEAMTYYADVFGGTNLQIMPYASQPAFKDNPDAAGRAMHAQLTIGDGTLMASDFPPGVAGEGQKAVSIMQALPDFAVAKAAFDKLADGGQVIEPFAPSFFAAGFGMVRDRFGSHWIITAMA